ncbi:MAG: type III-B CRISPR module RAMP protein Cmr4 [Nitrospirota bacterium]
MSENEDLTNKPLIRSGTAAALLFIHAQTALHPGSGTALGAVDLPVQRERHTQWPVIPGSTLKGILRDAVREKIKGNYPVKREENGEKKDVDKRTPRQIANEDDPDLVAAFGPGKIDTPDQAHAGALNLTDARILAFPVRSLKGVFAWVTCSAVLERLVRDMGLAQEKDKALQLQAALPEDKTLCPQKSLADPVKTLRVAWPQKDKALCLENGPLLLEGSNLVLEEFEFGRTGGCDELAKWIAEHAFVENDCFSPERFKSHLVVLHDSDFTHFVRHATEVVARIALDYERKTVKNGALFYEEFLPAETLFYSVVFAGPSRRAGHPKTPDEIMTYLGNKMPTVLQIGADETIGKGICAVRLDYKKAVTNGNEKVVTQ